MFILQNVSKYAKIYLNYYWGILMDSADTNKSLQQKNNDNLPNAPENTALKQENKKKQHLLFENYATSIMLGLAIAFLLIFIFGITCVVSKFISIHKVNEQRIFGFSVIEVTNSFNQDYFPQGSTIVISTKSYNQINIGDFVICDGGTGLRKDGVLGQIEYKNGSILKIKSTNSNEIDKIYQSEQVLGVVSSNNPLVCGLVKFLLSNGVLWLFVVIPGICLIALALLYLFFNLHKRENLQPAKQDTNKEGKNINLANSQQKQRKKKSLENKVAEFEQLVMQFDENDNTQKKEQQVETTGISTESKQADLIKNKSVTKKEALNQKDKTSKATKSVNSNKIKIASPRPKKETERYVFNPLPPTIKRTDIREILDKNKTEISKTDVKYELLQKMRKTK